jgi:putative transposase
MGEYRHGAHTVFGLKYHVVWITKYRYEVLQGDIAERAREVIRQICAAGEVTIARGAVPPDHIHVLLSAPRSWPRRSSCSLSKGGRLACCNGTSQRCARGTGVTFVGAGHFCASVDAVDEKTIRQYELLQQYGCAPTSTGA